MRSAHILLLSFLLFAAPAAVAQPPAPVSETVPERVEDVYLARDNGSGKAGDLAETFSTTDIPIHCIVMLLGPEPAAVKMNLVAVKVAGVKPDSKVVTAEYTTKQGQNRVFFTGRPDGTWVPGTYRFDIFVEGKKERSVLFEIKGGPPPTAAAPFAPKAKPKARTNKRN